ncbi:MAG: ABC transporter ATP-binding protein [Deltaproteobacteria bacterium]|jgi:peptide/nickel transport system ATP-binding protein|nr:ABC transporter ATP-binding protein [Deltaproteobacteria bacterium]
MFEENGAILTVENLTIRFSRYEKGLRKTDLVVINGLDVSVGYSELVAVVGSSGSGKSLLAHTLLGILPSNCGASGAIKFMGEVLDKEKIAQLRGKQIVLVPQSVTYLDPLKKVGPQVRNDRNDQASLEAQEKLFDYYGLKRETAQLYPFELSGGMARRVLLSAAMMETPKLIIADEPTPGLHLSAAKKAMRHFRDFADEGNGVLLITHDLELALEVADKIAVFYAGTTVEVAPVKDFQSADTLRHPYTKALWHALPQNGFQTYPGTQPYAGDDLKGCPFAQRCQTVSEACQGPIPSRPIRGGLVRCHLAT